MWITVHELCAARHEGKQELHAKRGTGEISAWLNFSCFGRLRGIQSSWRLLAECAQVIQHLFANCWAELQYTPTVYWYSEISLVFHRTTISDSGCIYFGCSSPL